MPQNYKHTIAASLAIAFVFLGIAFWLLTRTPVPSRAPISATTYEESLPANQVAPAVLSTRELLARPTEVDFFETSLAHIVALYQQTQELEFELLVDDPTPVTYKSQGKTFGDTLTELLATIKCDYTVGDNGQIIIQAIPE